MQAMSGNCLTRMLACGASSQQQITREEKEKSRGSSKQSAAEQGHQNPLASKEIQLAAQAQYYLYNRSVVAKVLLPSNAFLPLSCPVSFAFSLLSAIAVR